MPFGQGSDIYRRAAARSRACGERMHAATFRRSLCFMMSNKFHRKRRLFSEILVPAFVHLCVCMSACMFGVEGGEVVRCM